MNLYDPAVLRWATRIRHTEPLEPPFLEVSRRSRVCGSHLTVFARLEKGVITDFSWEIHLCAVGQAVTGMLSAHVIGLSSSTFNALDTQFRDMVLRGHAAYAPPFEDFALLASVYEYPSRHGSALLPFDCLRAVFEMDATASA